jgi:hypothetical protein
VASPGDDTGGYADIGTVTLVSVSPVLGGGELVVLRMAMELSGFVPVRILGGAEDPLVERARAARLATSRSTSAPSSAAALRSRTCVAIRTRGGGSRRP